MVIPSNGLLHYFVSGTVSRSLLSGILKHIEATRESVYPLDRSRDSLFSSSIGFVH